MSIRLLGSFAALPPRMKLALRAADGLELSAADQSDLELRDLMLSQAAEKRAAVETYVNDLFA